MHSNAKESAAKSRGTLLLEEFENSLPNFSSLDEAQQTQFSKAIHLMARYYTITQSTLEKQTLSNFQLVINRLKVLHKEYLEENKLIASAIFFVMTHIKSYYLDGPDAALVHSLTSLHIYYQTPLECGIRPPSTHTVEPQQQPHPVGNVINVLSRMASSVLAGSEDLIHSARLLLTRVFMQRERITNP